MNLVRYRAPVLNVRGALSWMSNVMPRQSTYNPTSSPVFYPYLYLDYLVVPLLAIGYDRSHLCVNHEPNSSGTILKNSMHHGDEDSISAVHRERT